MEEPIYKEPLFKTCQTCIGKGHYLLKFDFENLTLPRYVECEFCNGTGEIEYTEMETLMHYENEKYGHYEKY